MYFKQFCEERGIKEETIKSYRSTIKRYSDYYEMTFEELLNEAIDEENDSSIRKRERNLRQRLLQFRTHLITETDLKSTTVRNHIGSLYTLYSHFDVELPKLPPVKTDDIIKTTYFDLPNKKHIAMALDVSGVRIGSLILFMASSGTGRSECESLTIKDFIKACSEYYKAEDLRNILNELHDSTEEIIPTFYMKRIKTGKPYYTFCTPEATNMIVDWLLLRLKICDSKKEELKMEDSLWGLSKRQITYHFTNINDELEFGFKGPYRFFRPHSLRKFHASNIGLSKEHIDLLEGRSRGVIHETYIKTNPEWLKKIYINAMENVTIGKAGKREVVHEEFTININLNFYGNEYGVSL